MLQYIQASVLIPSKESEQQMGFITYFFDLLGDMFNSGWLGAIIAILLALIVLGLIGLVLWGIFHAVDSWFLPKQHAPGIIISRSYDPEHWQPMVTSIPNGSGGSTTIINQIFIPASWSVKVRMGERTANMSCSERYYKNAKQDQPVTVEYVDGRLSSKFYIKSLL